MENFEGLEKRQFLRVDYYASISFELCKDGDLDAVGQGLAKNISSCGILFCSKNAASVGTFLVISLDLHTLTDLVEIDDRVVQEDGKLLGKVVRVEEVISNKEYDIGVCLVTSDEYHLFEDVDVAKIKELLATKG